MPQDPRIIDKEAREAWRLAPLSDLIHHIVEHYHLETRVAMGRLESYAEETALLDGRNDAVLLEVRNSISQLGTEMRAHLISEERVLFPAVLRQAEGREEGECVSLPVAMKRTLLDEHEAEASLLRRIRALSEGYEPTAASRGAHLKLQAAIKALSENLQQHLFLENQILLQRIN